MEKGCFVRGVIIPTFFPHCYPNIFFYYGGCCSN